MCSYFSINMHTYVRKCIYTCIHECLRILYSIIMTARLHDVSQTLFSCPTLNTYGESGLVVMDRQIL